MHPLDCNSQLHRNIQTLFLVAFILPVNIISYLKCITLQHAVFVYVECKFQINIIHLLLCFHCNFRCITQRVHVQCIKPMQNVV